MSTVGESEQALRASFDSILQQLYPYWELILLVEEKDDLLVASIIGSADRLDPRVKIARPGSIRGFGLDLNQALAISTGEFIGYLLAGDSLSERALYEFAVKAGRYESADLIYADVDEINPQGNRDNPWFKPGWDPDLLLGVDYISNCAIFRRELVEDLAGLRSSFPGAELYELALRVSRATTPDRVRHVPGILCHIAAGRTDQKQRNPLSILQTADFSRRAVADLPEHRRDDRRVSASHAI